MKIRRQPLLIANVQLAILGETRERSFRKYFFFFSTFFFLFYFLGDIARGPRWKRNGTISTEFQGQIVCRKKLPSPPSSYPIHLPAADKTRQEGCLAIKWITLHTRIRDLSRHLVTKKGTWNFVVFRNRSNNR